MIHPLQSSGKVSKTVNREREKDKEKKPDLCFEIYLSSISKRKKVLDSSRLS